MTTVLAIVPLSGNFIVELIDTAWYMIQFAWYALGWVLVAWLGSQIYHIWYARHLHLKHGVPEIVHSKGDTIEAEKNIREFLKQRIAIVGEADTPDIQYAGVCNRFLQHYHLGRRLAPAIENFISLCHAVGCEVVIRQVADHSIEVPHDQKEVDEMIAKSLKVAEKAIKKCDDKAHGRDWVINDGKYHLEWSLAFGRDDNHRSPDVLQGRRSI